MGRGLVAQPIAEGRVYVGWRLLDTDPPDIAFHVYRQAGEGKATRLSSAPVRKTTDFIDASPPKGGEASYFVRPIIGGKEGEASQSARATGKAQPAAYVSLKLDGDHTFQKVGIADLNADGRYDFVLKQPSANVDPYIKYWKKSPETYKLEAYRHDGTLLWRYDMGWAIERGIWYSPYVVYDLDGDGRAEIAVKAGEGDPRDEDGRVTKGPEHLTILDGRTGKAVTRIDWPSRKPFYETSKERGYNYASRNQLAVAYLDGRTPHLLVERGTYNVIVLVAYRLQDGKLREAWRWDNRKADRKYWGQGAMVLS